MIAVLTGTHVIDEVTTTEHTMTLEDGTRLFYRAWIPTEPSPRALVLFHRGHEHSGRLEDVVRGLGLRDVAVFAWDARGHGRSGGARGYAPGFPCLAQDADAFVRHISAAHGKRLEDLIVFGHSVGAVTAAHWVHDYAPSVRAMVLVTPALRVKLYVPFARTGLRLLQLFRRRRPMFVSSYVKGRLLTHDPEEGRRYDTDPLVSRRIAVNVLLGLHDTATRLIDDAAAIQTPTLVLAGGADWVVDLSAEARFFDRLGSDRKQMRVFDGMYHDILHEKDRHLVFDEIRRFVRAAFASEESMQEADEATYTRSEYERLSRPLPCFSPKRFWFAAQRGLMKTAGLVSDGIRVGWRTGFDSGTSLDYVYENRARGAWPFGWIVDRIYLNSAGWKGIRQRKVNTERALREVIEQVRDTGMPVRILDVAAGHGRYVIETLASLAERNVTALLRDFSHANVEAGRTLAGQRGLTGVTFEKADAFDLASYRGLDPRPNVAIVSGLFELFPDNAPVRRCLDGLASALDEGGYLIYTGQPWHPQIEMIARVLRNRDGGRWVMRRRPQRELDSLVSEAGFTKISTKVDERGIFTVSIARKGRDTGLRV